MTPENKQKVNKDQNYDFLYVETGLDKQKNSA